MNRCICAFIPSLNLKTKVSVVVHAKELKRSTNTGRLAIHALTNSELRVRGEGRTSLDLSDLLTDEYRTLLLFPSENALELTPNLIHESPLPIQLIVPDGNWGQARKVVTRQTELKSLVRIKISKPNLFHQYMRAESTEYGMATLQAIAHALSVIEGSDVGESLMAFYRLKLEQTLRGRGILK